MNGKTYTEERVDELRRELKSMKHQIEKMGRQARSAFRPSFSARFKDKFERAAANIGFADRSWQGRTRRALRRSWYKVEEHPVGAILGIVAIGAAIAFFSSRRD